jgi:phosphoglycolate phosphatase
MVNTKLVIFDLDGTLVDAYLAISRSFNYVMRQMRYPKQSSALIRRAVGWGDENLLKPFVTPQDLKKALWLYRRHHQVALVKYSRLMPKAKNTLDYLKSKGYKLAVASNRPTKFSQILIRRLRIDKYFDFVLCADKLRHGKPNPEIIKKIMGKLKVKQGQVLYVGDMVIDAQAARRAQVKAVLVTTGSSTVSQLRKERPYKIIPSLFGLIKIL